MRDVFDSAFPGSKSVVAPNSAPMEDAGSAAPIGVPRVGLTSALAPARPRNRHERRAREKRLREFIGRKGSKGK